MTQLFNGISVDIRPPISSISVNKLRLVLKDSEKLTSFNFESTTELKSFIRWLVVI